MFESRHQILLPWQTQTSQNAL